MNTTTATKKFALTTLAAPVLAALAIGLAGTAAATPAGPQPSDTGTTATANLHQHKDNPTQIPIGAANTGRGGGVGDPIRGDLPIAPIAGPRSSDTGTTATTKPVVKDITITGLTITRTFGISGTGSVRPAAPRAAAASPTYTNPKFWLAYAYDN